MKEFDYTIIGGGCAGLSLAYELNLYKKLENKTLAIVEPRQEYKRDKTWSFWKVIDHNFDDCVIKNWGNFSINSLKFLQHMLFQSILLPHGLCYFCSCSLLLLHVQQYARNLG